MLTTAILAGILAAALTACARFAEPVIFRPKPIDDVLYNPHVGFQTFQHFNGDPLFQNKRWTEIGPEEFGPKPDSLENRGLPPSTVAYCRWYWDTIEPKEAQYRWDIIDGALATARERGQTLAIRVMCHDHDGHHDVPEWFKKTGARGGTTDVSRGQKVRYWLPDYSDPLYIKYWTRLNAELAARYDGRPDLEFVDCASIGPWGEWSCKPVNPPMSAKAALIDCYTNNFKKTPCLMQFDDAPSMRYGVEHGTGWRADCLGDLGGFSPIWCHMFDCYPQGIVYGGAVDAWKTSPVSFEVCWVMGFWHEKGWDVDYIFNQAIKWHFSTFNTKSSAVPDEHWPAVNRCLKRMGYRFVLRKFLTMPQIRRGALMHFHTWWENTGCAPIYRRYDLALQLKSGGTAVVMKADADVTKWLPGDTIYDGTAFVPYDLPTGKYALRIAMLDKWTGEPKIQFASAGRSKDGWHDLGEIEVVPTDKPVARYVDPGAP
jgi:hypothetical protein